MTFDIACMLYLSKNLHFPPFGGFLFQRSDDQSFGDVADDADQDHRHHQIGRTELVTRFHEDRADAGLRSEHLSRHDHAPSPAAAPYIITGMRIALGGAW